MAKENAVIMLYATATQDAAAAIDVPDDGLILRCTMFIDGILNVTDEGIIASLEFGSVNTRTTNDTRSLIALVAGRQTGTVAAGVGDEAFSQGFDYGEGITVFGGERLYLHTGVLGGGVLTNARALIVFNFGTFKTRRR
jgi:hypothetical protein